CGVRAFVILPWAVNNCAEIDAVNKALKDNSSLHDLEMATVHTGDGSAFPNCRNCQEIFKYLGINVLTG
ncbi:hypothetical protein, partial [Escherichia coli]